MRWNGRSEDGTQSAVIETLVAVSIDRYNWCFHGTYILFAVERDNDDRKVTKLLENCVDAMLHIASRLTAINSLLSVPRELESWQMEDCTSGFSNITTRSQPKIRLASDR